MSERNLTEMADSKPPPSVTEPLELRQPTPPIIPEPEILPKPTAQQSEPLQQTSRKEQEQRGQEEQQQQQQQQQQKVPVPSPPETTRSEEEQPPPPPRPVTTVRREVRFQEKQHPLPSPPSPPNPSEEQKQAQPWPVTFEALKNFVDSTTEGILNFIQRQISMLYTIFEPTISFLHRMLTLLLAAISNTFRPALALRILKVAILFYIYHVTVPNIVTNLQLALQPTESIFLQRQAALSSFPPPLWSPQPHNPHSGFRVANSSYIHSHPSFSLPAIHPLQDTNHLRSTLLSYTRRTNPYAVLGRGEAATADTVTPFSSASRITQTAISKLNQIKRGEVYPRLLLPLIAIFKWPRDPSHLTNKIDAVVLAHSTLVHPAARCRYHSGAHHPDWYGVPAAESCGTQDPIETKQILLISAAPEQRGLLSNLARPLLSTLRGMVSTVTRRLSGFGPRWEVKFVDGYTKVKLWDVWDPGHHQGDEDLDQAWDNAFEPVPFSPSSPSPVKGPDENKAPNNKHEYDWKTLLMILAAEMFLISSILLSLFGFLPLGIRHMALFVAVTVLRQIYLV